MLECCTICQDEEIRVDFSCMNFSCAYKLCAPCIREAFLDSSGVNSAKCPMCQTPTAIEMIESLLGKGAVKAVENKVRSTIEFDLKRQQMKKEFAKKELVETNVKARQLFNEVAEKISMKCPRCKTAFDDYDGCNALSCATCKAGFCAICLQDCESDSHAHVLKEHGDYFDRDAFEKSRENRTKDIVGTFMNSLSSESEELKQLVKNHVEKAGILAVKNAGTENAQKIDAFVDAAHRSLLQTVQADRLSILRNQDDSECFRKGLAHDDISPRSSIPEDFQLYLIPSEDDVFHINLRERRSIDNVWVDIPMKDIDETLKDRPKVDSLMNIKPSLHCSVLAIEGEDTLYQTRREKRPKNRELSDDEICISLEPITRDGGTAGAREPILDSVKIIGMNQNLRIVKLLKHVEDSASSVLVSTPIQQLIGAGSPTPIFTEIIRPIPETSHSLNEQQGKVAHPLKLKTAMEVAGPPGTGKTKTIVELVRALLECSDHDIIVLSERNGAINAIAEKFAEVCLKTRGKKVTGVSDALVWTSVMTYGAGESMGEWTKLFTLEQKLRCVFGREGM
eukprot:scaffold43631_cov45-Attheya_sp.AAC.2